MAHRIPREVVQRILEFLPKWTTDFRAAGCVSRQWSAVTRLMGGPLDLSLLEFNLLDLFPSKTIHASRIESSKDGQYMAFIGRVLPQHAKVDPERPIPEQWLFLCDLAGDATIRMMYKLNPQVVGLFFAGKHLAVVENQRVLICDPANDCSIAQFADFEELDILALDTHVYDPAPKRYQEGSLKVILRFYRRLSIPLKPYEASIVGFLNLRSAVPERPGTIADTLESTQFLGGYGEGQGAHTLVEVEGESSSYTYVRFHSCTDPKTDVT